MVFNFENYKGDYVMFCNTKEESEEFCKVMAEDNRRWVTGRSYLKTNLYKFSKEGICYLFNSGHYCSLEYAKEKGYKVLKWSEFENKNHTR